MSASTSIEWTNKTWNPLRGCSPVSPGCKNCFAARIAARFSGPGQPFEGLARMTPHGAEWTGAVQFVPKSLTDPSWRKPQMVFVNSMSDLFHKRVSDEILDRVFGSMAWYRHHTYQVLTKRADRMLEYSQGLQRLNPRERSQRFARSKGHEVPLERCGELEWPLPNVWLGVSVEDQRRADERVPLLQKTPAAVRFLSAEPLLGPIRLCTGCPDCPGGWATGISWVIVGGESGPGSRPCSVAWVRDLLAQCRDRGVACFVKQMGSAPVDPEFGDPEFIDPKGGDPSEWPPDLRVREFPEVGELVR